MTYALFTGAAAAVAAAILGRPLIAFLRAKKLGKSISSEGPESHMVKAGTPTMGGVLFMGVALAAGLIAGVPKDRGVLLPVAVGLVLVVVGIYDDLGTLLGREVHGAHERSGMLLKLATFTGVAVVAAWILYGAIDAPRLLVPHYGAYDIGPVYIVIASFVIVAMTSAVGVTDGLDMLAGSTCAVAFAAFGAIALFQDQVGLATFCFAVSGALLGFLWWNAYPARVFMGEAGALPLGATLAIVSLMTGWWLLAPLVGVVFVAEILADVIQIGYFHGTGKRFFRMAPLHCHFEKVGWPETTITARFLAVGVIGALCGVALAALN
ncbi:MAG: phospho-N-acetylmuramoyl-pentapeptide-transferase [Dehalococcoidia bacterium]|nr:phospho-N-acetylmuramoyl-pentapeptide-transferase [Dehalococcoidia bacterium]